MRTSLVVALYAGLFGGVVAVSGCSSAQRPGEDRERLGAADETYRRPAGEKGTNAFDALDLPTPTERRLGSGAPGPGYWQQRADYAIDCTLDESSKRLDATMRVRYHNNSPHELAYLWVQLEQNLFRQDSLGTQSRGRGVMRELGDEFNGGYEIGYLRSGGQELEYAVYDTLARVELERPIRAGEVFEFEMGYAFEMPPHLRRMGAEEVEQGTIFEYAQWFPHVCNYDDVNGWNTLPYLGAGEFYTNFGDYEVSITVPRDHVVTATGELMNASEVLTDEQRERLERARGSEQTLAIVRPEEVGTAGSRPAGEGALTWRFRAENVRTFAWATSDAFIWDACGADVTDIDGTRRRVLCQSFYPKEAESWRWTDDSRGSTQVVKHAIEFYSEWLYPYPYPVMSNVNGPEGGMEYPMIVFCGSRTDDRGMVGVTDHEVGHNWYPMLVNTDERRYMWQDEGLNSFINIYSIAGWYGEEPNVQRHAEQTARLGAAARRQRIDLPPDRQWDQWLGSLNYRKTAYALFLLREDVLGPERFDRGFGAYTARWAFKSPQPADFYRTMEDAAGADLAWFWRGWFLTDATLDQGVERARFDGGRLTFDLVNRAEMVMPARVRIAYDDGTAEDRTYPVEVWGSTDLWRASVETGGRTPVSVAVDPDGRLPDLSRDDNTARVER